MEEKYGKGKYEIRKGSVQGNRNFWESKKKLGIPNPDINLNKTWRKK
jgi:hypothetical protein